MASIIKLLGSQTDLTSATTVGSATVVRVLATAAGTVTQKSAGGATVGTIQMLVNTEIVLSKAPDNTLEGGAGFKVVKVAYSN